MTGLYVMLALGLNVWQGLQDCLDLAYVPFFGIGAYLFASCPPTILASPAFPPGLPISALITMGWAFLGQAAIRLRATTWPLSPWPFSQIFKLLLLNLNQPISITGG